eukprot:TRINITY_DN3115_c1_g2_i3.p1 TRINITY_DN3115_c1_g2~~TRINITY_DN3115_c1_g2_i3.p1  ORF type:complete len:349 (-),score=55.76 TRINITY_DN3115_c1_g2_i3:349-1395(-)
MGWAASHNIDVGDEMVSLNSKRAMDMTASEFATAIKSRPLKIHMRMQPLLELLAREADVELGFDTTDPPDAIILQNVVAGSWAELKGLRNGDTLVSIQSEVARTMAAEQLQGMIKSTRPLKLSFRKPTPGTLAADSRQHASGAPAQSTSRPAAISSSSTPPKITVFLEAEEDDAVLGFKPVGLPPQQVLLKQVYAGGWAEAQALSPGDEILEVNGIRTRDMIAADFTRHLRARPLTLKLLTSLPVSSAKSGAEIHVDLQDADAPLGSTPQGLELLQGKGVVKSAPQGSWAQKAGLQVGDELVAVGPGKRSIREVPADEISQILLQMRPLPAVFRRVSSARRRSRDSTS